METVEFNRPAPEGEVSIPLEIHTAESDTVIINVPGRTGAISGYNDKHARRADYMQRQTGAAVVRTVGPHDVDGESYHESSVNHVEAVINYVLQNAVELFGQKVRNLILVGHSNGGFGIIENAHKHEEVSQIVLTAPAGREGLEQAKEALGKFTGSVTLIAGSEDPECPPEQLMALQIAAEKARVKTSVIEGGGHDFLGTENGKRFCAVLDYAQDDQNRPLDFHAASADELY